MFKSVAKVTLPLVFLGIVSAPPVNAQNVDAIRAEINALKSSYDSRIKKLENKLSAMKSQPKQKGAAAKTAATSVRNVKNNSFNPSIGIILNGKISDYSKSTSEIAGFGVAHEGERAREGLAIGETELNFSANADNRFYGSMTAAIVRETGADKLELEEAYVETLPGLGLPSGMRIKAGRAFWSLGYLNEIHAHSDDFSDRPLPYRAYLNKGYNDDGVQMSLVLPTDRYLEVGTGLFRGEDFPFGSTSSGRSAHSGFIRTGGDIGNNTSWRFGASTLIGTTDGRKSNEDTVTFVGDSVLYAIDARVIMRPAGNAKNKELILQGEYFRRDEDGQYSDTENSASNVNFNDTSAGFYAQAVLKTSPAWRIGARYSKLGAADVPSGLVGTALDSSGHDPVAYSFMADWTSSEYGRIRLQYNREEFSQNDADNQLVLQYVVSLGAHGAHPF
jgi:hypothetical protein